MRHPRVAVLAAAALVAVPLVPALAGGRTATGWAPRPATYGVATQDNVPVTMSDGVVLETEILRPALPDGSPAPGPFPVILTQTPYNKDVLGFASDYLVERGYIQVIADVRGTGSSEGSWTSFGPREQRDGYELAEWAHRLPGGNGAVALYGASYAAINQLFTAAQHPAGLRATFPIAPMADAYRDVFSGGGQIDVGFIPLWGGLVSGTGAVPSSAGSDPVEAAQALPSHAADAATFTLPTLASALTGGDKAYDGPFYATRSPINVIDRVDVPTFVTGGEYDIFQRGEPMIYDALARRGVPSRLLIGPWTHIQVAGGGMVPAGAGPSSGSFDADGAHSLDQLALRWFDRWVRGVPDPTMARDVPAVSVYRLGSGADAGRFQSADRYPAPDTRYRLLRLDGSATASAPGTLGASHPAAGTATLPWNPASGACSESTAQWSAGILAVGPCQSDQSTNDRLGVAYDLPVTGRALRFQGPAMARLYVSTTGTDGMISARLEDVAPDGTVTPITGGYQVLSMRAVDAARSSYADGLMVQPYHPDTAASVLPVRAGTTYELGVEIFPTSASVAPGHRLRLELQSADSPHLLAPVPQLARSAGGVLTVHADPAHPSALVLGVEP